MGENLIEDRDLVLGNSENPCRLTIRQGSTHSKASPHLRSTKLHPSPLQFPFSLFFWEEGRQFYHFIQIILPPKFNRTLTPLSPSPSPSPSQSLRQFPLMNLVRFYGGKILRGKMVIRTIVKLRHRLDHGGRTGEGGEIRVFDLPKKKTFKRVRRWSEWL